jgi:hypothetical protein
MISYFFRKKKVHLNLSGETHGTAYKLPIGQYWTVGIFLFFVSIIGHFVVYILFLNVLYYLPPSTPVAMREQCTDYKRLKENRFGVF